MSDIRAGIDNQSTDNQQDAGHQDFSEIAHSGGKVTFNIVSDANGSKRYQISYSGASAGPMRMFAIWALPQGIPVASLQLRGIGSPWDAPPDPTCIAVFISSDTEGFFGHECPDCHGYWRSSTHARLCPYCRGHGESFQFLTAAHRSYVRHYVQTLAMGLASISPGQSAAVVIDMDAIVDGAPDVAKPEFYYPGTSQQTKFKCSKCETETDIRGRYGFCTRCGWRNNLADLSAEMDRLRADLNAGRITPEDTVKKAVSLFDACCRDWVSQLAVLPMRPHRRKMVLDVLFHRLNASGIIERAFDIEMLKGMSSEDLEYVQLMFQRRHVFEHEGGVATRRYIEESGDKLTSESTLIRETRENAHRMVSCLIRMATNFEAGFHDIFPVLTG